MIEKGGLSSLRECSALASFCSFFRHHLRWLVMTISLAALTLIYANIIAFNFTVICMFRPENSNSGANCSANSSDDPKESFYYDYSVQQRNALFSAPAFGAVIKGLMITHIIGMFGTRLAFTFYGSISALCCFLMPMAVQVGGFVPLFILRIVQGCLLPVELVMISHLSKEWAPLANIGSYLLLLSIQYQLGPLVTMPISGLLCESHFGWPVVYYLQGILTLAAFLLFFIVYRSSPAEHPWVSAKELVQIQEGKQTIGIGNGGNDQNNNERLKVPYAKILSDPVIWIVLFTFWTDDLGFQVFIQYGPIYLNRVLGMDVRNTGFLAALPLLLSMIVKFMAGPINDRLPWKEERIRINIFSSINELGMIVSFTMLGILPMVQNMPPWIVQVVYVSVNIFSGLDFLGVIKCSQHISRQFSSTIMAWEIILSSGTVLLLPMIVGLAAPNNSVNEWARILFGIASVQAVSIVLFLLFCDSKPRPWTNPQQSEGSNGSSSRRGKRIVPSELNLNDDDEFMKCATVLAQPIDQIYIIK